MFPNVIVTCLVLLAMPPSLSVDRASVDLGVISPWGKTIHRFSLTNRGDKAIRLGAVETSCGCTVAELGKKDLAPGETTLLEASLQPKGLVGDIHESIFVHVQDAEGEMLRLTLNGKAEAPVWLDPGRLEFKRIPRDKVQVQRAWVRLKDGAAPMGSIKAEVAAEFQAFLSPTFRESPEGKALEVVFDPTSMIGLAAHEDGSATVMIEFERPGQGVERVPLLVDWSFPCSFESVPRTLAWIGGGYILCARLASGGWTGAHFGY